MVYHYLATFKKGGVVFILGSFTTYQEAKNTMPPLSLRSSTGGEEWVKDESTNTWRAVYMDWMGQRRTPFLEKEFTIHVLKPDIVISLEV